MKIKLSDFSRAYLMVKRGDHPCIGQWALPGGFVNIDENLDDAALRELREETGLDNIYPEQLYTWGDVGRDPRTRIITVSYLSLVSSPVPSVAAGDDADDARWMNVLLEKCSTKKIFSGNTLVYEIIYRLDLSWDEEGAGNEGKSGKKEELENKEKASHGEELSNKGEPSKKEDPCENGKVYAVLKKVKTIKGKVSTTRWEIMESNQIAFDHAKIIAYGIEKLREKIWYTDIASKLMPELFTLADLKQVYELILDMKLEGDWFKKKIAGIVIESGEYIKHDGSVQGNKHASLFRFNHEFNIMQA